MIKSYLGLGAALVLMGVVMSLDGAEAPARFEVSEFEFERPQNWLWKKPTSSMRKAELAIPAKGGGESGEVVFFYFGPGNGGGTDANVQRWFRQFKEPQNELNAKTESAKAGDRPVTFVEATGTFLSGSPFGPKTPKPGFSLLGAILEGKQGHVFVKLTGPKQLVDQAVKDFKKMIVSAKSG